MVFEKVRAMLAEQLYIDASEITMDSHVIDDLGADSLDIAELLTDMEDEFDIVITDESAKGLVTVREIVEFIEKLV